MDRVQNKHCIIIVSKQKYQTSLLPTTHQTHVQKLKTKIWNWGRDSLHCLCYINQNYKIIIYSKLNYNHILTETFLLKLFLFFIYFSSCLWVKYYYKKYSVESKKKGEIEVIYFIAEFLCEISFMKENIVI